MQPETIELMIQELLQQAVDALYTWLQSVMDEGWLCSLMTDGIVKGVGSLFTALPTIILLFFVLGLLEQTGLLARLSYHTDGLMHRVGLHGGSFVPLLMGFGCNVPAIMAAKSVAHPRERMLTMLMVPFISCSGRLPIYILLISTVFPRHQALVLLSLYVFSMLISLGFAAVMSRTLCIVHRPPSYPLQPTTYPLSPATYPLQPTTYNLSPTNIPHTFPALKRPSWKPIFVQVGQRVVDFLGNVFTVVLISSIVIWVLEYFPAGDLNHLESSWLAWLGKAIEPVMRPLGFDWKLSVCLLTGLPAKEAIASTFAILFGSEASAAALTPVSAYAFLVFVLLYFPCVATISTIRREINIKWAIFLVVYSLVLAWLMAWVITMVG
ncbi:MAG: ferrous iron transporter B [Paludibacteraceae bacterium]|nr:ferrous iron transporter B [Paludibacteraceae bacterium]